VDGYFTDWGEWANCSVTCGNGYRDRSRTCNQPQYGGNACAGSYNEVHVCI